MKETPKVHYTSRDYNSIYNDLIASIPALTDLWTGREDSDPGIVLTKLMASSGDMLHFNMDKQSLEFYRSTVTQRKNMRRILDLIHYKMHWYKSAIINFKITNNTLDTIQLATSISKADADYITQRVYNQYNALPPYLILPFQKNWQGVGTLSIEPGGSVEVEAVQGVLSDITFSVDEVINNRYYLPTSLVDQDHMWLEHQVVSATGQLESDLSCWELVPDLNVQTGIGRYFQFDVDEFDQPFIELVPYWQRKDYATPGKGEYFKLYYVETMANLGNVGKNVFSYSGRISNSVGGTILVDGLEVPKLLIEHSDNNTYSVTNSDAPGQGIETVEEAFAKSSLWINTYDTLVTIKDFEDYIKAYGDMSDCKTIDPQRAFEINQRIQKDTSLCDEIFDEGGNLIENSKFKKFLCMLPKVLTGEQQRINYTKEINYISMVNGQPFNALDAGWYKETQNLSESRYVYTYLDITDLLLNEGKTGLLDETLDITCNIPELRVESVQTDAFGNVTAQELVLGSTYLYYGAGTEGETCPWKDSNLFSYLLDEGRVATISPVTDESGTFKGKAYFVIKLDSFAIMSTQFSNTITGGTDGTADTFTIDDSLLRFVVEGGQNQYVVANGLPVIDIHTNTDLLNKRLKALPEYNPYTTKLFAIYNNFNGFNTGSRTYIPNTPAFVLPTGHHVCQLKNTSTGTTLTWLPCEEDDMDTPYQRLDVYSDGENTIINGVTYIKAPEVDEDGKEYDLANIVSEDGYIIDNGIRIYDVLGNDVTANYPKKFKEYNIELLADTTGAINTEVPDAIISQMNNNKSITCDTSFGTIRVFDWVAKGTIYLQEPVDNVTANEILVAVTQNLRTTFSPENVGIGNKIAYMDIVEAVRATDTRIRFFDPDIDLKYVDTNVFDVYYFNDVSVWNYVDGPNNTLKYTNGYLRIASESLK